MNLVPGTMTASIKLTYPLLYLCLLAIQQGLVTGFMCYSCSYDITRKEDWNRPECRNNTDSLGKIGLIKCDDDKFCTIQEVLDKGEKRITNYDRSCSATSLGNKCTEDFLRVICVNSCQGDYCNGQEVVDELKPYLTDSANHLDSENKWSILIVNIVMLCGINFTFSETWNEDDTPHIDFCRRHLIMCVIFGATSLLIITATIITCAVVIGYKLSKDSISIQYGTVVFKTTDNSSVLEKISIHDDGLADIRVSEKALIIFDYPHYLAVLHFAKFEGVCFVSQINDSWTHLFGLKQKYEEIQITSVPSVTWFERSEAIMDRNLIPYSMQSTCSRQSYWINESKHFQDYSTDVNGKCKPICVTFCLSRTTPCTKVCLKNPCKNSVTSETSG